MIRVLLLCMLSSVAVAQSFWVGRPPSFDKKPPPQPPDSVVWQRVGSVAGVSTSYTPIVSYGANDICVFSNSNGVTDGHLYRACGTWSSDGPWQLVFSTPAGNDAFIRTLGVARGASGKLYAVLYVGPCYGCTGGFSPAWATSDDDGLNWSYFGRVSPFGINQSSANNLVVDESRTDDKRFMFWMDIPGGLFLVHSGDGMQWTSDGLNQWPLANEQPQFVTAARTPFGVHLIGAIGFPATAHRHVFSCTGLPPWRVIEMDADTRGTGTKGTNAVYDASTNLIHALTTGVHYTLPASAFLC